MENAPQKLTISADWMSPAHGLPETACTAALIEIKVGSTPLTANEDRWSRSVRAGAHLSAYPLALWLAGNWWRLRWEPGTYRGLSSDWQLSHNITGANEGFLWPNIRFESTGEFIEVFSYASRSRSEEMVRYLNEDQAVLTAGDFEKAVDDFLRLVLSRLNDSGFKETVLHQICHELSRERASEELTEKRKLEAMAGFDPDEIDEKAFTKLKEMELVAGPSSVAEIAASLRGQNPVESIRRFVRQAEQAKVRAKEPALKLPIAKGMLPWIEGRRLAEQARKALGIGSGPISDRKLCETLRMSSSAMTEEGNPNLAAGLAVRQRDSDHLRVSFRRNNHVGRRFEIARILGDSLRTSPEESWLAATDSKTARQKSQRAFAVEFLCPFQEVRDMVPDFPMAADIHRAAKRFKVSSLAVASELVNHGVMPAESLKDFQAD